MYLVKIEFADLTLNAIVWVEESSQLPEALKEIVLDAQTRAGVGNPIRATIAHGVEP